MCGIYKITNMYNGKIYIGQSIDIKARWRNHRNSTSDYALYRAFRKYGIDNFKFEVIEECNVDQLNERECYWINYYDSYFNGYNETLGGNNGGGNLSKESVKRIIDLLLAGENTNVEIGEMVGVSDNMVSAINVGRSWRQPDLTYPLRPHRVIKKIEDGKEVIKKVMDSTTHYCARCGVQITHTATHCEPCARLLSRKTERPSAENLAQLLKENNGNFSKVGRMFGVTGNAIVRWCKGYGLPWHSSDYKVTKPKGVKSMPIPVEQWTIDGRLVATFSSLTEAEQKTGITHIREASDENNTSRKTAGGYIWKRSN